MSYLSRVKTWIAGEILYASDLNAEFNNAINSQIPEPSGIAQGDMLYKGASDWEKLPAGTAGQALVTGGASANPSFAGMTTQGDIEYHNGTTRTRLAPGTAGYILKTGGVAANPSWLNPATLGITGEVRAWAGAEASPPSGWLLCDGDDVSRTTYAGLFAVIGETYGVGDGSTTFNLPDFRGRAILGVNNSGLPNGANGSFTTRDRGDEGGVETHTLTENEIPAHVHGIGGASDLGTLDDNDYRLNPGGSSVGNSKSTGGGAAHQNMMPFGVANYIIKT